MYILTAQCRYECDMIASCLPNLKQLHVVEPDDTLISMGLEALEKVKGDVKVNIEKLFMKQISLQL